MRHKADIGRLIRQLESEGISPAVRAYDTTEVIQITCYPFCLWIDRRPHYCDRGRWQVNVESLDVSLASIDQYDMFPRYYFLDESLAREVRAWLDVRMVPVKQQLAVRTAEHGKRI